MRTVDEPTIMPEAKCGTCRTSPWTKWCRACNLVYCDAHIDRKSHTCKPDEERPQASSNAAVESTETCVATPPLAPPQNGSGVAVQMPMQLEIFTTPPPQPDPPPATE